MIRVQSLIYLKLVQGGLYHACIIFELMYFISLNSHFINQQHYPLFLLVIEFMNYNYSENSEINENSCMRKKIKGN